MDLVIFMHQEHFDLFTRMYKHPAFRYEMWDVPDLVPIDISGMKIPQNKEVAMMKASEQTFENIKRRVDELIQRLPKTTFE